MQRLKQIPFFLLLLVVFFCLHGSVENYGFIGLHEVLILGLIIAGSVLVLFLVVLFFTRNYLSASLISFFIVLWYLFFGAIHDWIKSKYFLSFLHSYTVLLPLLLVITVAWIIYLQRYKTAQPQWTLYLNLLLMIYCSMDGVRIMRSYMTPEKNFFKQVAFDPGKVKTKPNMYYLLFDEYPGYKSLQDSFGFRNDSLYRFFAKNEFQLLPTFANYDFTLFSMSSIFNMQYVDSNYDHKKLTQKDMQQRLQEIKNAGVISLFSKMGYKIENYSIFDIAGQNSTAARNSLFPVHTPLLTDKIFHNRILKDLAWWLVTGKFKIESIREKYLYRKDRDNQYTEKMIIESSAQKTTFPKFCYGHFLLPHRPYYRDSTGNIRDFKSPDEMYELFFDKEIFLSYLKYTNKVISSLIKNITHNDPNAIIVVMSDHGFHTFNNSISYNPYNYNNICAVRFPDKNYINYKEKWSTVNFFRYLFNCEFGQQLPYLSDSTIWINL